MKDILSSGILASETYFEKEKWLEKQRGMQ